MQVQEIPFDVSKVFTYCLLSETNFRLMPGVASSNVSSVDKSNKDRNIVTIQKEV